MTAIVVSRRGDSGAPAGAASTRRAHQSIVAAVSLCEGTHELCRIDGSEPASQVVAGTRVVADDGVGVAVAVGEGPKGVVPLSDIDKRVLAQLIEPGAELAEAPARR